MIAQWLRELGAGVPGVPLLSNRRVAARRDVRLLERTNHSSLLKTPPTSGAIARTIKNAKSPRFQFNYRTEFNEEWDRKALMKKYGYSVTYATGSDGLTGRSR